VDCATEATFVVKSSANISTVIKSRKIRRPGRTDVPKKMNYRNFKEIESFWFKWKDMGLKEVKYAGSDWIQLTEQRPVAGSFDHDDVHSGSIRSEEYRNQ